MFFQPICVNESLPVITLVDHVEHLVDYTTSHKQSPQLWHVLEHGILFFNLDYAILLEKIEGLFADSLLLRCLHKVHFPGNVNWLISHTVVASLGIHAEVAILKRIGNCVMCKRFFPGE